MYHRLMIVVFVLATGASCLAQDGLVIRGADKQDWQADAEKVYESACSALQREFHIVRPLRPHVTLIIGAHENGAYGDSKEIRLTKWDPFLFAQGVVFLAFDDLLPRAKVTEVAKRAVTWADSVVEVQKLRK